MYVTADQKRCTNDCGSGFKKGANKYKAKTCVCDGNKFYDVATDTCISAEKCEGYTYELDG